jgi:PKD repeat protein
VDFTNLSTGDFDSCDWDFGDGGSSTDCNDPSHTYAVGTYTVTLTVMGNGGVDTETKVSYITVNESYTIYFPLVLHNHNGTKSIVKSLLKPDTQTRYKITNLSWYTYGSLVLISVLPLKSVYRKFTHFMLPFEGKR